MNNKVTIELVAGLWQYHPESETVFFLGDKDRGYEFDLESGKTATEMLKHLEGRVAFDDLDSVDLQNLLTAIKLFKPNLPCFTRQDPSYISKKTKEKYKLTSIELVTKLARRASRNSCELIPKTYVAPKSQVRKPWILPEPKPILFNLDS
jgi:hypothetical protein